MKENFIKTDALYFSYPDGTPALQDINLCVNRGEFLGILGANGSGKTTLLKILNGLLRPTQGEVYLDAEDVRSMNRDTLFSRVCTCFQNPDDQLFSATVGEDIAFGPKNLDLSEEDIQSRIISSLNAVGMSEYANRPIHSLSFGEKKRVCLAGVLAMNPEVILLDEPTASLDPRAVNSIMQLLRTLNKEKGKTLVMATHSVDLVPLFIDRIIILNQGRIIRIGTPAEVFSEPEKVRLANLRLPRIGHLFEVLSKKDGFTFEHLPLTISEARREIKKL